MFESTALFYRIFILCRQCKGKFVYAIIKLSHSVYKVKAQIGVVSPEHARDVAALVNNKKRISNRVNIFVAIRKC